MKESDKEKIAAYLCDHPFDVKQVDVTVAPAMKADQGKADLSHIYGGFLAEVSRAMEFGAQKYARGDYLSGHKATKLIAALLRHTFAWLWGEEKDPESGVSHLGHAGANIMMIIHQRDVGTLKDDRTKK